MDLARVEYAHSYFEREVKRRWRIAIFLWVEARGWWIAWMMLAMSPVFLTEMTMGHPALVQEDVDSNRGAR